MFKKYGIYGVILISLIILGFLRPVQILALDVLSIFRTEDVQKIEVTSSDIQEVIQKGIEINKENKKSPLSKGKSSIKVISAPKKRVKHFKSEKSFKAFPFRLPKELRYENPKLTSIRFSPFKFKIQVKKANKVLDKLKSKKFVSNRVKNAKFTCKFAPIAVAQYEDVLYFATQKSHIDIPDEAKNAITKMIVLSELLPMNLSKQIADMDIENATVYLPVIQDLGRQVDIGKQQAYIYTVLDYENVRASTEKMLSETQNSQQSTNKKEIKAQKKAVSKIKSNAKKWSKKRNKVLLQIMKKDLKMKKKEIEKLKYSTVLIWVDDGVIYGVIGNKTDQELIKIARSVDE